MLKGKSGFTIVELLIVIVVIAILAAISIVAYNGIQQRARDNIRKSDLAAISKALKLYNVDKGDWMGTSSGCGYNGDGWGWFNRSNDSLYTTSINSCLKQPGYLQNDVIDPSGGISASPTTGFAYMKYNCGTGSSEQVFLYAKLESLPQSSTAVDAAGCATNFDSSYGMNYYVQVK